LGPTAGTAIVVGSVLGTGVFLKSSTMAQTLGSESAVLAAWIAAGVLSFVGALVYSELGARFPEAGGEYVYLRNGLGDLPAFLFGWTRFWIISPASIAAYAVGSATFLAGSWLPVDSWVRHAVALGLIGGFTALNLMSVVVSGGSQTFLTALKIGVIAALAAGAFFWAPPLAATALTSPERWTGWSAFGAALIAALWAYDGWNNLPMMAGELRKPSRDVPLSLALGSLIVMALYVAINAAYFHVLPYDVVASSNSGAYPDAPPVAARVAEIFMGETASRWLALAFVLSAIGAMNGQIFSGARVPYAMAKDGLFFRSLEKLSPHTRVPVRAVVWQSVVAGALALSGSFDQLTDSVVFASWLFYAAATVALFRLRRTAPADSGFRCPGYPWVPGIFLLVSVLLVVNALWTTPALSALGLLLVLLGVPVFYRFRRR
jgi:APA family basic amino acid/polyamine antiporter